MLYVFSLLQEIAFYICQKKKIPCLVIHPCSPSRHSLKPADKVTVGDTITAEPKGNWKIHLLYLMCLPKHLLEENTSLLEDVSVMLGLIWYSLMHLAFIRFEDSIFTVTKICSSIHQIVTECCSGGRHCAEHRRVQSDTWQTGSLLSTKLEV